MRKKLSDWLYGVKGPLIVITIGLSLIVGGIYWQLYLLIG